MAIRVIQKGVKPSEKTYRGKCSCGELVDALQSDLKNEQVGRQEYAWCRKCDTCDTRIEFKEFDTAAYNAKMFYEK